MNFFCQNAYLNEELKMTILHNLKQTCQHREDYEQKFQQGIYSSEAVVRHNYETPQQQNNGLMTVHEELNYTIVILQGDHEKGGFAEG